MQFGDGSDEQAEGRRLMELAKEQGVAPDEAMHPEDPVAKLLWADVVIQCQPCLSRLAEKWQAEHGGEPIPEDLLAQETVLRVTVSDPEEFRADIEVECPRCSAITQQQNQGPYLFPLLVYAGETAEQVLDMIEAAPDDRPPFEGGNVTEGNGPLKQV